MERYFEPDDRWGFFGVNSKEQYAQRYLVKGYFHELVPIDIKDAWTTVEYLLAHAYYHWPMYDEGFNKSLRLLEMAIKQKAIQQGDISKSKSFEKLINEICREPFNTSLKKALHRARKIRNKQVHSKSNSYSGVTFGKDKNLQLFVILINELFRSDDFMIVQFQQQQTVEKQLKIFENNLLILEFNASRFLVSGILGVKILNETLFLVLNPVLLNTKQVLKERNFPNPIALMLSNFEFQGECLIGTSDDGQKIKICRTDKTENLLQFSEHQTGLDSIGETKAIYEKYMEIEADWSLVKLEYNYLSKTQSHS